MSHKDGRVILELASLRKEGTEHGLSRRETLTLFEHLDALTAENRELRKAVARAEAAERTTPEGTT